jgi:hypothetical protein
MKTINFCGKLSSSHLHPLVVPFFLSASTAATYIFLALTCMYCYYYILLSNWASNAGLEHFSYPDLVKFHYFTDTLSPI